MATQLETSETAKPADEGVLKELASSQVQELSSGDQDGQYCRCEPVAVPAAQQAAPPPEIATVENAPAAPSPESVESAAPAKPPEPVASPTPVQESPAAEAPATQPTDRSSPAQQMPGPASEAKVYVYRHPDDSVVSLRMAAVLGGAVILVAAVATLAVVVVNLFRI